MLYVHFIIKLQGKKNKNRSLVFRMLEGSGFVWSSGSQGVVLRLEMQHVRNANSCIINLPQMESEVWGWRVCTVLGSTSWTIEGSLEWFPSHSNAWWGEGREILVLGKPPCLTLYTPYFMFDFVFNTKAHPRCSTYTRWCTSLGRRDTVKNIHLGLQPWLLASAPKPLVIS